MAATTGSWWLGSRSPAPDAAAAAMVARITVPVSRAPAVAHTGGHPGPCDRRFLVLGVVIGPAESGEREPVDGRGLGSGRRTRRAGGLGPRTRRSQGDAVAGRGLRPR